MPGALIEQLVLTDPFECTIAASTAGQRIMATAIAQAISTYLAAG